MVRRAIQKNVNIIKELQRIISILKDVQGNLENYAQGLGKKNLYAAHLLGRASEIRMIIQQNENIISLMIGENIELEKEREILEADAKRYHIDALKSLAEA